MAPEKSVAAPAIGLKAFLEARDLLLAHREDYETAVREFRWPTLTDFKSVAC